MAVKYVLTAGDQPDLALMGGKAHALAALGADFPVPLWFVLTPLTFDGDGLREAAYPALTAALDGLGAGPFAVRSSAVEEDGEESSFAGQLESHLNVAAGDVERRVLAVWRSAFADSVIAYRAQRGLSGPSAAPAVLIQRMVDADAAGVAFSVDPMDETRQTVAIMAVRGLADRLVGGEVNGDTYRTDREGALRAVHPADDAPVLSATQCAAVTDLALRAESHFGAPQDIEWAFEGESLYLLQSRPITTLAPQSAYTLWDNSNIVESYSGVTAPLTFSFARYVYAEVYRAFSKLMGVSEAVIDTNHTVFENMLGYVYGHVYYNLLNWYRVLALFPGFTLNRTFMEQMMGVSESLPDDLVRQMTVPAETSGAKVIDALRLSRTLVRLVRAALSIERSVADFHRRLRNILANPEVSLANRDLPGLAQYYRSLEHNLLSRWDSPLVNDFLCMIAFGLSRKVLLKWCGANVGQALHNDFMIGQGDIISAEPAQRIRNIAALARQHTTLVDRLVTGDGSTLDEYPQLAAAVGDYLDKFGDRCTQELKLESITLHEDPTPLLQAIGFTARKEHRPEQNQGPSPEARLAVALRGRPVKRWLAGALIRWTKARIRDRENLRFERTRLFGRVRQIFLEIGRHLCERDLLENSRDIFHLEVAEILGVVEGSMVTYDLKELVTLRKRQFEEFQDRPAPPNRLETRGAVLPALMSHDTQVQSATVDSDSVQGLGCCSGVVRAPVRVVTDPRREALQPGEILVAQHTDPGWIALFCNASGIIVERGSLLSHSAIVAREMGIPAVVAVDNVMSWLQTGDVVEMDGASGRIIKVDHGR